MASGQDLRITDVPFSNLPATTATVFINDNGKLRQTDLTTVAKNSELRTMILDAHQHALEDIQNTHDQNIAELELIHDHTLDDFQRASDQHIQTLDEKLNTSSDELSQLIEAGHEKLQDDIKVVDELCAYAATVRETTFEKDAQLMPTVPGNVIIGSIKGDSYQKQETRISRNLAKVNEFTADNTVYTLNLSEELKLNTLYHIQADVEVQVGELNGIHVSFGDASTTFPIVDGRISAIWDTSILSSTRDYLIFFPNDIPVGSGGKTVKFSNVMLTESDTEVAYEPYFEPQVSPSPTFPQEIESVGDSGWFDGKLVQGSFNMGAETTSTTRLRSDFIPVNAGDKIEITVKNALAFELFLYDENKSYLNGMAMNASTFTNTVTKGSYMRFSIRYEDNTTITPNDDISVSVTINGQYATHIKTVGKNLLRNAYYSNDVQTIGEITWARQSDGSVVANGTTASASSTYRYAYATYNQDFLKRVIGKELTISMETSDANITYILTWWINGKETIKAHKAKNATTFTIPSDYDELRIYLQIDSGVTVTNATAALQIELGSEATEYQPYTSSTLTIPLTEPLRAIGDVKDEICVQDGKYGVLRRIMEVVLNGSEDWSYNNQTNCAYGLVLDNVAGGDGYAVNNVMCNRLITCTQSSLYEGNFNNGIATWGEHSKVYVRFDSTITTLTMLKSKLAESPITVHYELATPVFEPFADQTPFYELMAHDGVTDISIVCGDNLNPSATVMYPSTESGALLVNAYADSKMLNQKLDEEVELRTRQLSITKGTLTAGATSVVIEDEKITKDSLLTFYTSIYSVSPAEVVVDEGSVTLIFDSQETDMEVGVQVNG